MTFYEWFHSYGYNTQLFDNMRQAWDAALKHGDKQEAVMKALVINGDIAEYEYVGNLSDGEYLLHTPVPMLTDAQHATLLSCALRFEAEGNKPMASDIRALLTAAPAPSPQTAIENERDAAQWRPIETAPKDGSMFLGWVDAVEYGESDDGRPFETSVSDHDFCQWVKSPDGGITPGYFENMMGTVGDASHITHWMPLPCAPAAIAKENGHD